MVHTLPGVLMLLETENCGPAVLDADEHLGPRDSSLASGLRTQPSVQGTPPAVGQLEQPGPLGVAGGGRGLQTPTQRHAKPAAAGDACGCPHTLVPALLDPRHTGG